MRRITPVLIVFALCLPAATASAALRIKPGKFSVVKIGKFKPRRDASVPAAVRAFGDPTRKSSRGTQCTVTWKDLGLKIRFSPDVSSNVCDDGIAYTFTATGEQFATNRGLRVRASASAVLKAHPNAERHRSSFWLATGGAPDEEGGVYPLLQAEFGAGRVTGFKGFVLPAGE